MSIRDAASYCAVLFDNNNGKPICRLRFNNESKLVIGLFDGGKEEERISVASVDDLFDFGLSTKSRHEPPASRQQAKARPASPVVREVTPGKGALSPAVRARGTRQKSAIRSLIEKSRNPLLPAEILEGAKQAVAGLGLATIYRNLKTLVEAGEVRAVELPGEPTRFESAHLGHHHHFQCRNCMKVFDVHSCSGDFPKMVPRGFTVERHELTLYGLCSACTPPRAGI